MVQDRGTRIIKCPSQNVRFNQQCRSKTTYPACQNKYSTLNFVSSRSQPQRCARPPPSRINCHNQNRSYWDKCTASSCLVGFMKFIQHQCYPKRKHESAECGQSFFLVHDDVFAAMRQLRCDLDSITDMEKKNCGKLTIAKNGDSPRKILTRMACKMYEIEDSLMKPNVLTCSELLTKRKVMLTLIRNLQKTIGCYLEGEVSTMQDRKTKLCSLLRCLQSIENEFRCMTKGVNTQCCAKVSNRELARTKSNLSVSNCITRKKSCLKMPFPCTSAIKINSSKNYEVTGVDLVYTKSTIKTSERGNANDENNCNCDDATVEEVEECIDKKIACHIPACGEPVCEVKIRDGNETLQLCDSQPLKDVICQNSQVWQESAKQLINAFHSC